MKFTTWFIIEAALVGFFICGYLLYRRRKKS
jgi:hypothetical protein